MLYRSMHFGKESMNSLDNGSGIERYFRKITALQTQVVEAPERKFEQIAAQICPRAAQFGRKIS